MLGLALMAAQLAYTRTYQGVKPSAWTPGHRRPSGPLYDTTATAEYYRIIDRLSRGEKP